jgi:hypothetical protein
MPYEKVDAEEIIRKLKRILEILKIKYETPPYDEKKFENSCLD